MPNHLPDPFNARPWDNVAVPADAAAVPTMLTEEEGALLHWLARDYATGAGAVVDLGCFAGGSTARLASGVAAAGRTAEVHAFDHFTLTEEQKDRYLYPAGIARFRGKDMLPAVKQFMAPWQQIVTFHRGDITKTTWTGGPIEILFIDASKTPNTADRIAQIFMPHLIPGRSIIVQQDYLHWRQPWVPAQMELFGDCFELVGWCAKNTVIFRTTCSVTAKDLTAARTEGLSDADLTTLIGQAMGRFPNRPQRADLARAIMGIEDNPGTREPHRMTREAFTPPRVSTTIQDALRRLA